MVLFFTLVSSILVYFVYRANRNTYEAVLNRVTVNVRQNDQDVIRILHLSDLHLENLSISPDYLYNKLKDEHIDLIALTGDFLDRKKSIPKLVPYLNVFQQLNPAYGIYAVFGNHDYVLRGQHFQTLKKTLEQHGCILLQNETRTIFVDGKTVNIIGIDDFSTKRSDLQKAYANVKDGLNLVLTHDPNIVLHMHDYHFDYLLSGHFHGGQIHWPKPYHLVKMGKLVRMNMIKGYHEIDGKPFYISEGLGQTGVNIRVGTKPEITIHTLSLMPLKQAKQHVS
ncbi:metallophosphoesterase [Thermaerobacillus caldiproteolyticus]|uniref:metallophosphoesterase n=1 Tax=Thermaerobacillus caldiproteolyticus TaxID=247480 RepID=UPI00188CA1D5|nr:metallophosphoesterase [Anoxybacillus caldiproteolyticus]QPA32404.1 metallophosphoesterase [Anoxybacillus caldiproteolyticus]